MLIQGKLERRETNLMHFKWEVTRTNGNQPNTFYMGQCVNSHFDKITKSLPDNLNSNIPHDT